MFVQALALIGRTVRPAPSVTRRVCTHSCSVRPVPGASTARVNTSQHPRGHVSKVRWVKNWDFCETDEEICLIAVSDSSPVESCIFKKAIQPNFTNCA